MNWSRVFVAGVGTIAHEWDKSSTRTKETGGMAFMGLTGVGFGMFAVGSALAGWWFWAVVFGLIAFLCIKGAQSTGKRSTVPFSERPDVAAYNSKTGQALSVARVRYLVMTAVKREADYNPALVAPARQELLIDQAVEELERSGYRVSRYGRSAIARGVQEAAAKYVGV